MQWKEIEITDSDMFNKAFRNINSQASEMSFRYMYMWRKNYNTQFAVINNMLCIVSISRLYPPFAFCPIPLGEFSPESFKETISELRSFFTAKGFKFIFGHVEECMVEVIKKNLNTKFKIIKNEDSSDYIYETGKLITLSGKKLSAKRNHINKFMREYGDFEYEEITPETAPECMRIFNEWCEKNDSCECEVPEECEKWACSELLNNWSRFPELKGALIKIAGRFEAFTIGEMLNDETAVIHIEKGNTDIFGIYPLINKEFVSRTFPHTKYMNREEDMGKEGLRKAKLSYNPIKRLHKYIIIPE